MYFADCEYEALFATTTFNILSASCVISNFLLVMKTLQIPTKKLASFAARCGFRFA